MSRPSITMPPPAPSSRCRSTSTARTRGRRATAAAARSISGVRIARETSSPSISDRRAADVDARASAPARRRAPRRRAARRSAAPSSRRRGTSRRCRRAGSPAPTPSRGRPCLCRRRRAVDGDHELSGFRHPHWLAARLAAMDRHSVRTRSGLPEQRWAEIAIRSMTGVCDRFRRQQQTRKPRSRPAERECNMQPPRSRRRVLPPSSSCAAAVGDFG